MSKREDKAIIRFLDGVDAPTKTEKILQDTAISRIKSLDLGNIKRDLDLIEQVKKKLREQI